MDMKVEQLPRDFIAASHVARVAIQLANIEQSTPEQELNRAWRLIEVAQRNGSRACSFSPGLDGAAEGRRKTGGGVCVAARAG
jgi:hypothetical protein